MSAGEARHGGCQCGAIRYRLDAPPLMLYACHCSDCQKQSASAFGLSLIMDPSAVVFTRGEERLAWWETRGDDGALKRCAFCPDCGSRILHASQDPLQNLSIKAGSLDDTSGLQPLAHIWLDSAQPWVTIDRGQMLCFEQEPDDDELKSLWQARRGGADSQG